MKRDTGFWILISVASLLSVMFLLGQTLSLFDYDLVVKLGLQESEDEVGKVGVAFLKGYAFGDTLFYIPLFIVGMVGLLKNKRWGKYSMFGAMTVSVYWPLTILYAIFIERSAITLQPDKYVSFMVVLPLIIIYGLWGMRYLYEYEN